jgi:hypothetical protein
MATVNLGSIKFKWKGTYSGATAYTIDDVVEYNGSSYICILASTGNLPTNATYFEQMSSAGTNGTNGTDLTTTLTTQGDLVYRDGSGIQRLGAGTAGQVLQTGGAGANPSWGSVSSDYVKITSGTLTNVADIQFLSSNFDGSTYDTFDIYMDILNNGNLSGVGQITFSTDNGSSFGASLSGNNYYWNSSSTAPSASNHDNDNHVRFYNDGIRDEWGSARMTWSGLNTSKRKTFTGTYTRANHDGSARVLHSLFWGQVLSTASTNNAIRLSFGIGVGTAYLTVYYKIYGRKA